MLNQLCYHLCSGWAFVSFSVSLGFPFPRSKCKFGSLVILIQLIHLEALNNFEPHGYASSQLGRGEAWTFIHQAVGVSWLEQRCQFGFPLLTLFPLPHLILCRIGALFSSLLNLFCCLKTNIYIGQSNSYWSVVQFTYRLFWLLYKLVSFGNRQTVMVQGRNLQFHRCWMIFPSSPPMDDLTEGNILQVYVSYMINLKKYIL